MPRPLALPLRAIDLLPRLGGGISPARGTASDTVVRLRRIYATA